MSIGKMTNGQNHYWIGSIKNWFVKANIGCFAWAFDRRDYFSLIF